MKPQKRLLAPLAILGLLAVSALAILPRTEAGIVVPAVVSYLLTAAPERMIGNPGTQQTAATPPAGNEDEPDGKFIRSQRRIAGKYIVVLEDSAAGPRGPNSRAAEVANALSAIHGGRLERVFAHAINGFSVEMNEGQAIALSKDPRVAYVEEDSEGWASTVQPNATWGLDRIDQRNQPLDTFYNYTFTGAGIHAYILDTGIRTTHVDFAGRASSGFDAIGGTGSGTDCNGHGTHVAGTVGGTTWGVAKNVSLVSVRVLGCTGVGSASSFIAGVDWVTQNAIRPAVVNMSLGTVEADALNTAVNNSINSGLTYVVAAGNETQNACNIAPASAPAAITVSASNLGDQKAGFANYGICVDMFAPGEGITSAWHTSDTDTNVQSGTSMAAPHVAGAAALYLQANPGATPAQVRAFLYSETTKGIINASNSPANHLLYTNWAATPILPPNAPPTASFAHSCNGLTCTFDGTASSDPDGAIAAYAWDFGDGQIGYGANVTHTYASFSAFFSVKLEVLDDDGERSSPRVVNGNTLLGTNIPISEQFGQARVTFSQVTATGHTRIDPLVFAPNPHGNTLCDSCPRFSVTTGATFTGPVTACIDVPAAIDDQTFNSMSLLRYTNFDDPPVNVPSERITNQDGTREVCGQSTTLGTYVIATQLAGPPPQTPPTLSNTAITSTVENGTATLTGNISDPNVGDTFTLTVNWGDGSAPQTFNYAAGTTAFSETHRYLDNPAGQPTGGLIVVNMTLADSAGGTATWALNVTVNNVAPSLSNITANPSTVFAGGSTTVTGNISDPGTLDSLEVTIDWRDGTAGTVLNLPAGSTTFSAPHQFTTPGTYNLIIVARDKDFSATVLNPAVTVTVNDTPPPDLNGVSVTTPISENGTATLSGNMSSQAQNATFTLSVNWGDGSQPQTFNYQAGTTSFSETHQYLENGNFPISVTLTDSAGGSDTGSADVTVNNAVPTLSNVQVSPTTITAGGSANLTGNITDPGSLDTQTISIAWGDGSQNTTFNLNAGATSFNSSHVYTQVGAFNISVTATDDDGAQGSGSASINVVAPLPTPTPTPIPPRVPNLPFTEIGLNGSAFAGLTPGPNGRLYGVTYDGPVSDNDPNDPKLDQGTLFSVDPDMTNRIDHHIFIDQTDGNTPYNELTWVPAEGKFFGATSDGGAEGSGKIFTYDPATDEFFVKPGGFTGSVWGSLALLNGNLYGVVQSSPQECIFRLRPSDFAVSFLHCVDAFGPRLQGLTAGDDGWLYGNSVFGGIACDPNSPGVGCGEIFKIRPWNDGETFDPQYQVIFQFQFYGGRDYPCPPLDKFCVRFPHTENNPIRQLEYGSDGHLYGSTFYSVFRLDPHAADVTDSFKTLWNDGGGIQATVIEGVDGRLYFTDYGGGTEGVGRVLSMYKNGGGVFELRNFTLLSGSTAYGPNGRLYQDPATRRIYGTTEYTDIASPWPGTAFVIDVPPAEYRLSGSSDGTQPIVVDDALDIYVNDALMYTDGIAGSGLRGPIEIPDGYLDPGDVIRFVVRDTYGVCTSLSPVYLVDNFGSSVLAHPGFNLGCGRPAGDNGISDDRSFTVPGTANTAPTISNLSVTGTVSEGGVAALSFLVSDSDAADNITLRINWGDGSAEFVDTFAAGTNIPINLTHNYLDDNPTPAGTDLNLLTVTVTDGLAIASDSRSITVNNLAPSLSNLAADPSPATVGTLTTLTGVIGDTGTQDTFTIQIDWGDNTPPTQLNRPAGTTSFSAEHKYDAPGNFSITTTVHDDDGGAATTLLGIVVDPAVTLPDAPTGLVATAYSTTQIDLSWNDNSTNEDGFRIVRCNNKKCAKPSLVATVGPDVTTYSHAGLMPNTTYIYRVFAFNSAGDSAPSNDATGKTPRR